MGNFHWTSRGMGIRGRDLATRLVAALVLAAALIAVPLGSTSSAHPAGAQLSAQTGSSTSSDVVLAGVAPGTFTGLGFDACTAPSSAAMQAWLASPYRAIGIYFGGINRGCTQPNLTAAWVSEQQAEGWHLLPIYMGLQAPCTTSTKKYLIDPAQAAAQGRSEAQDAFNQATALGLSPGSILISDMEAYRTDDAACRTAVLSYEGAWTKRLHELGYLSGFYSSMNSGVADQVAMYSTPTYPRPDYLDFARWDGVITTSDPVIPSTYWPGHRRMKQYKGGHIETWGGVSINIDNDYVDFAPIPATPFGDFNRNGWPDLVARKTTTSQLLLYPGHGTGFASPTQIGSGWNGMSAIVRFGDFNRDGYEDIIAREAATGYLWLYRWTGTGFTTRLRLGTGWNTVREITAVGDMNRDGYNDVLAVQSSTGYLYLYPGNSTGTGFGARIYLGYGWNTMDEVVGVGDMNRDGYRDFYARQKATGNLYFYPGRGAAVASRVFIGTGWNTMRDLVGVGDFDRNGIMDMFAIQKSTNYLFWYRGLGTGTFAARVQTGYGWATYQPLL